MSWIFWQQFNKGHYPWCGAGSAYRSSWWLCRGECWWTWGPCFVCAREGSHWMSSGLVLWTEGLQHLIFIRCICVCRCTASVWVGFFHNESILWLLHLLHSVKQSLVGTTRWIPVKKLFCCELKPSCQHVLYWLWLEFPASIDSERWAEFFKWDEENHHASHL